MNQFPTLKKQIQFLIIVTLILFIVSAVNLVTANSLNNFGLIPRELHTLPAIFIAPWLHGSAAHLLTNLIPLLLFMWLTMQWPKSRFWLVTLTICVVGGMGVWLFGRTALHIGASGMVYGYFGFLILAGFRSRQLRYIAISVLVALLYGGMLMGILPSRAFISFEYHLFGFFGGLLAAWAWAK
ncbi:rhomboid family intramembrane serine protease [Alteromonas ponticola]|uniref:Rhomboid family intramembrane serine protease n=1 Tax=Alteromonas aquimaris TaxID=2998417 RepID=A0ABT3P3G3_9ALTE|nr:rhomboid family intramembrane serine protease [Alteromonas aquimaris]MCW8107287.1 rhomboid family intramembrane serine protease [Alteromonas aquimaris]